MKGAILGLVGLLAASSAVAQTAPCATPVWDKFCVGMTGRDVRAAYGKDQSKVWYQYSVDAHYLNTGDTLSDVTVKFDQTTPDAIVQQLTAKYGKPTTRQVQTQVWQTRDTANLSNGATVDRLEWRKGPVIISTDVPHDPSIFSVVQYRVVDTNAPAVPL